MNYRVPPELDNGTYRFEGDGYDGQFYRYLAHDPFLQANYHLYVDTPQLRFRRILVPLAAWLFALGQRDWIDRAYIGVEIVLLALGAYWCARLLARRGRSPLWGFLFLLVPATLASFDRMLVDGPLTALFAGFMLYCEEQRWARVWLVATLAALTRETGLIVVAALVTDRLLHREWKRAAWFSASGVPAIAWYVYLAVRLPPDPPVSILAFPAWGLFRRLLWLQPYPHSQVPRLLQATDFLAVLGLGVSIVLAARWLVDRPLGPATLCAGLFAAMALVLGSPGQMIEAIGFSRPVSPLLLWIMIEAVSREKWIALTPPLLVSLSVCMTFTSQLATVLKGLLAR